MTYLRVQTERNTGRGKATGTEDPSYTRDSLCALPCRNMTVEGVTKVRRCRVGREQLMMAQSWARQRKQIGHKSHVPRGSDRSDQPFLGVTGDSPALWRTPPSGKHCNLRVALNPIITSLDPVTSSCHRGTYASPGAMTDPEGVRWHRIGLSMRLVPRDHHEGLTKSSFLWNESTKVLPIGSGLA